MDYNDVPLFLRVVESGSFTAAADALGVQKSAISRSVARLEEELGVRLLQRTTRKLALTEAGTAFYEGVRGAVARVDDAIAATRELGAEPRGTVRVTAPVDAYALGVGEAVAQFTAKHSSIRVELTLTSRVVDLVAEGFDLAVRAGALEDSTLVARRAGTPALALFAAPSYLRSRGRPRLLAELAEHACILFRAHGGRATWTFEGPNGRESVQVTGAISADEMSLIMRACVGGGGIAVIPVTLAREPVEREALELVLEDYTITNAPLHVVLPSSSFVPARVALLRDHLVAHLEQELDTTRRMCRAHQEERARRKR